MPRADIDWNGSKNLQEIQCNNVCNIFLISVQPRLVTQLRLFSLPAAENDMRGMFKFDLEFLQESRRPHYLQLIVAE